MTRSPAVLATVIVLSGFRTVRAEPCPPRAELGGDGVAVEQVAEELRRLGVSVARTAPSTGAIESPGATPQGCLVVRAVVELDDDGGIAVAVRGATRGSEGRVVSDPVLAAAWIDSWTRDEVDVALWAAPPAPRVASLAPPASVAPHDVAPVMAAAPPRTLDQWTLAAAYERSWSGDGAEWSGGTASACARAGGFCLGARVRASFDQARAVNATAMERDDWSVLATASYPIAVGTMSIAPELGLGLGRLATRRIEGSCVPPPPPVPCEPTDPNCVMDPGCTTTSPDGTPTPSAVFVGDNFFSTTYAPRLALAVRMAVPLFEYVWLDAIAGLTLTPLNHDEAFPAGMTPALDVVSADQLALPGEPRSGFQLGIGLRLGAR